MLLAEPCKAAVGLRNPMTGAQPLHEAACAGDANMVRVLLGEGADVNARDHRGSTPLMALAARSYPEEYIQSGFNENSVPKHSSIATWEPQGLAALRALIDAGADVRALDYSGKSAILALSKEPLASWVETLVGAEADPDWVGPEGFSPVQAACIPQRSAEAGTLSLWTLSSSQDYRLSCVRPAMSTLVPKTATRRCGPKPAPAGFRWPRCSWS